MGENNHKIKLTKFSSLDDREILNALIEEVQQLQDDVGTLKTEQELSKQNAEFETKLSTSDRDILKKRLDDLDYQVQTSMANIHSEMKDIQVDIRDDIDKLTKEEERLKESINANLRNILWAVIGTIVTYLISKYL